MSDSNVGMSFEAADRKSGMSLSELKALVEKAERLGVPQDSPVFAEVGLSQRVKFIHLRPEKRKNQ